MVQSKTSKATSKAPSFKSEATTQVAPEFEGTNPEELIFHEWSDQELNAEKWEHPKPPGKEKTKGVVGDGSQPPQEKSPDGSPRVVLPPPPLPFRDPHSFVLPTCFSVYKWKRPEVLFPGKTLVVYKEQTGYSNFANVNAHIMGSDIMRAFVANVGMLEYLSQWPIEGVSAAYTPNTVEEPWRGWHHVYSACKAGKGQKHKPQVNKLGKYILRLYWMGAWRRVVVDDFIPVDVNDHILLPQLFFSQATGEKSNAGKNLGKKDKKGKNSPVHENEDGVGASAGVIELWPFLLCKGIIKIANLTWTEQREVFDFTVMTCFTGWVCQKLNAFKLDANEIWDICVTYAKHYKWPDEDGAVSEKSGKSKKGEKKDTKKDPKKDKPKSKPAPPVDDTPNPFCIVAKVVDVGGLRDSVSSAGTGVTPYWSHVCLVNQIRNIPIDRPEQRPVLASWKRFRWVDWARLHGIFSEEDSSLKYLQLVDIFKEDEVEAKSGLLQPANPHDEDYESQGQGQKQTETKDPEDPTSWVDFYHFGRYIERLYVYFKPQLMQTQVIVTDVRSKETKPMKGTTQPNFTHVEKKIIWPYQLKPYFNQPLYIFLDTLDPKLLIISLSHNGNRAILEQTCLVVHCDLTSLWQKKFDIKKRTCMRTIANIVVEKYDWQSETFGDFVLGVNTYGTSSEIMSLKEGRQVLRLWVGSTTSYNVTILSDGDVEVGSMEYILEVMKTESARFLQFCLDFGTTFGNWVQAFGTDGWQTAMRSFYKSFQGDTSEQKRIRKMEVRQLLVNAFTVLIKDKYPECGEVLFCLRVLFLNPSLGRDSKCPPRKQPKVKAKQKAKVVKIQAPPKWDDDVCLSDKLSESTISSENDLTKEKRFQWAACKIQAFFKMIYIRKIKEYHKEEHPYFSKVFETLKKLYKDLFNVDKRLEAFPNIFRRVIMTASTSDPSYLWYEDLYTVLNIKILTGSISSPAGGSIWVPIGRYIFYVDSPLEETVKIVLFSNIECVLRVINNDTLEETFRGVNSACVAKYTCNAKGYTILGYGWTDENQQTINYKFDLITLRRSDRYPLIVQDCAIGKLSLSDVYHHNTKGLITRVLVGISNDVSFTLRMRCSYDQVLLKLRCLTKEGKLVKEVTGKDCVIMPVLNLEFCKENSQSQASIKSSKRSSRSSSYRQLQKSYSVPEKLSLAGSQASRGSRNSSRFSKGSLKEDPKCCYYLEALVMKHSWPLTKDEWNESDNLIKRNYLGASSKTSMKKSSDLSRARFIEYDTLPDPKWSLNLIHNPADVLEFTIDQTRCKEIRTTKQRWLKGSPQRFEQGRKLREDFLAEMNHFEHLDSLQEENTNAEDSSSYNYSIVEGFTRSRSKSRSMYDSDFVQEEEEKEPSRTLVRPGSSGKPLDYTLNAYPSTLLGGDSTFNTTEKKTAVDEATVSYSSDLSWSGDSGGSHGSHRNKTGKCFELIDDDGSNDGILKKPEDFEQDLIRMQNAIEGFEESHQNYIQDMTAFRERSLMKSFTLQTWFEGVCSESGELLKKAYRKREKFIEMLREKKNEGKESPDGKKGKKGKKDKKCSKKSSKSSKASKKTKKK